MTLFQSGFPLNAFVVELGLRYAGEKHFLEVNFKGKIKAEVFKAYVCVFRA